jgi:hypothetical protein
MPKVEAKRPKSLYSVKQSSINSVTDEAEISYFNHPALGTQDITNPLTLHDDLTTNTEEAKQGEAIFETKQPGGSY